MTQEKTFLWHDYETFGANPALDRPAQFAALRTNLALEPVGEPINWYCQPAMDVLPHPAACLVTGITPQEAMKKGLIEAEFSAKIHAEMMEPGTCSVGYNSIRFDDEFSRNLFYRNFYDPYEREYKNGNNRSDLIDLARMCYALRPDGIEWPEHEPGVPSFRLEDLSCANGISHEGAHEALSDVMATIGLAKLIKAMQPRLFDWALQMRNQHKVMTLLNTAEPKPLLHTSFRIPARRGCTTLVLPLSIYPDRDKSVIAFDLMGDPEPLLKLTAEQISDQLFTPAADLPEGIERIPLKEIKSNHVPMIAPMATLKDVNCERIGLDVDRCMSTAEQLLHALPVIRNKVMDVYQPYPPGDIKDPDHMIYSGNFFSGKDRQLMREIHRTENDNPAMLGQLHLPFQDSRLPEMFVRYRARNYPATLNNSEFERWDHDRLHRLQHPGDNRQLNFDDYHLAIQAAREEHSRDRRALSILDQLEDWGNHLLKNG
jgi:exodeoxyribonuclease-1